MKNHKNSTKFSFFYQSYLTCLSTISVAIIFFLSPGLEAQVLGTELVPQKPDANGMVIMPDGRRCRGIQEIDVWGREITRLIECEGKAKTKGESSSQVTQNTEGKNRKPQSFSLDDGQPHYSIKLAYTLDPKAAFHRVKVGSYQTKADMLYTPMPVLEFEYGFYNRYAWNFVAGAGLDFEKQANSVVYNFGQVSPNPVMSFSSLNLYLSIYRSFDRFYIQGGGIYTLPQMTFDRATFSKGVGGLGFRLESGYMIDEKWALFGSYREFALSAEVRSTAGVDFLFKEGKYSDFLLGLRYVFR
jgi:hypothetical protein